MTLQVGMFGGSIQWEELLAQEGVPWVVLDSPELFRECSVVVVAKPLDAAQRRDVQAYLKTGGAVLSFAGFLEGVASTTTREERIDYIVSDHDTLFPSIELMDLGVIGHIPKEANCLRTQQNTNAVFAGDLGEGWAVLLPFDPASALADSRPANKQFYAPWDRLPSERVSAVSKGEVARIVHESLVYLHQQRGLPYVHSWYFPFGAKNIFAFRVDTDKGSKYEIDKLCHLAVSQNIRMTLFADVRSHDEWLQHFAFLSGQEVGVHCYEHRTFDTYEENLENIAIGKRKLSQVGVSAPGFSAPFGMWNTGLAQAIDQIGFEYSSEFSFAYDTLPFHPVTREKRYSALQVPIHPICIGSMLQVGYSPRRMTEYFSRVIDKKLRRNEPLFFYHHPTHHGWDVIENMFQTINAMQIQNMTFVEFVRWWRKRLSVQVTTAFTGSRLAITSKRRDDSVWMRVIMPDGREALLDEDCDALPAELPFTARREPVTPPEDIRRIREFDPRRELADLFTSITRKLSQRKSQR